MMPYSVECVCATSVICNIELLACYTAHVLGWKPFASAGFENYHDKSACGDGQGNVRPESEERTTSVVIDTQAN